MTEPLYKQKVYSIVGAAMEVHNELGSGFLKAVYQGENQIIEMRASKFTRNRKISVDSRDSQEKTS